ncbi:5-histidylcysteine sulfoxide synthase [Ferrimonas sediminicola]|uniref:5-histidylcysteine sulfoxide synthase n=1 Tax=Ferrimonas sediminicola TaxID=2569538 RepID=A0A4V5NVG9_9GAMM|nr:5-histidylcysteine sulfoxide synthase [Ferrimonas sediminicola]TKB50473.1 5-histidylcysteine sulfoxide synthase [Ferrimonas sediminicola]
MIQRNAQTLPLSGTDVDSKRAELKRYFATTWRLYENLFEVIVSDQAYYLKAEPLRHPLIFYFGHTATFFVNKLKLAGIIDSRINAEFESMFAVGVDEMSWDDLDESNYRWPDVDEVRRYRDQVFDRVNRVIDTLPLSLPIDPSQPAWVILMGIEHERIHLETSSVIIRQLPLTEVRNHPDWPACPDSGTAPVNTLVEIEGGVVTQGRSPDRDSYGWDNEYGHHQQQIDHFQVSRFLVSNQEFMEFIDADGYQRPEFWSDEGQAWLAYTKARHPRFWRQRDGRWYQRNLTEEIPLPLNWPVEVNQLEAKAFCNWKAEASQSPVRLPTEAEWQCLRRRVDDNNPRWDRIPGNLLLDRWASSCPVDHHDHAGLFDVVGNVWQWTDTAIKGFGGFEVHPLYDDFSTPTFDGKHNLMKGGSWISTGNEALAEARYAFRRHFYQHAGFRYLVSHQKLADSRYTNSYETDALVAQYLEFHYGVEYFGVRNFPKQVVSLIRPHLAGTGRALDIGCSVGRASFELTRQFDHVDGIDFSARFIQHAYDLLQQGEKRFAIPVEGELVEYKTVTLADLDLEGAPLSLNFVQGDACNLKPQFRDYDLVLASNLLDRLAEPGRFLDLIGERLRDGGLLVLVSPYTWLEEFTPRDQWLGGFKKDGESFTTLAALKERLTGQFALIGIEQVPFVIRETARKHQHTLSEMTLWRKKP